VSPLACNRVGAGAPAPAPSVASDSAKQFASFASRTGRSSARSRSACSGRPFSQVEFAFFTTPVAGEMTPGMPMPTGGRSPLKRSISRTSDTIAAMLAA